VIAIHVHNNTEKGYGTLITKPVSEWIKSELKDIRLFSQGVTN
jgi:hypothetical protein